MKRNNPKRRGLTEQRHDSNRHYGAYIRDGKKEPSRVNPIFLQDHYGVKKEVQRGKINR